MLSRVHQWPSVNVFALAASCVSLWREYSNIRIDRYLDLDFVTFKDIRSCIGSESTRKTSKSTLWRYNEQYPNQFLSQRTCSRYPKFTKSADGWRSLWSAEPAEPAAAAACSHKQLVRQRQHPIPVDNGLIWQPAAACHQW